MSKVIFDKPIEFRGPDGRLLRINMPQASYVEVRGDKTTIHFGGKIVVGTADLIGDSEFGQQSNAPPPPPT